MPAHDHFDVYLIGKGKNLVERRTLVQKLEPLHPLDRAEVNAFVSKGERLRVRRGLDQDAAMRTMLELQAIGGVVELQPVSDGPAGLDDLTARLAGVDGSDATEESTPEPKAPPPSPEPDDARFAAPKASEVELALDIPRPVVAAAPPPPEPTDEPLAEPRCASHHQLLPCARCEREQPVPGRLFEGKLRQNPLVRLAIGAVLGLLVGWAASSPYASRSERRVAELRAEANVDRYKNDPELRAGSARLDARAEALSSRAFYVTLAIWLGVAGACVALFYRLT